MSGTRASTGPERSSSDPQDGPASACDRAAVCPRCGMGFPCGAQRPAALPCDCAAVTLDPGQRAILAQRWQTCLCPACLRKLAASQDTMRRGAP